MFKNIFGYIVSFFIGVIICGAGIWVLFVVPRDDKYKDDIAKYEIASREYQETIRNLKISNIKLNQLIGNIESTNVSIKIGVSEITTTSDEIDGTISELDKLLGSLETGFNKIKQ